VDLQTMRTRLRERIGSPSTTDVTDAALNSHINLALEEVGNKYAFHKMRKRCRFTTEQGVSKYALPSDIAAVLRLANITSKRKLEKRGDRDIANSDQLEGEPTKYVRYRDYTELLPIPDGEYVIEVYYKVVLTEITADTEEPVIPQPWHMGVVLLARWYYYDAQGDIPKASYAMQSFDKWVQDKPVEIHEESVDIDSGVELPTITEVDTTRLDFNESD
jgi:hypothetical protein